MIIVELPELGRREYTKEQLQPLDELEAFNKKAQAGCGEGKDGCDGSCATGGSKKT
jgi:hypothetical protein